MVQEQLKVRVLEGGNDAAIGLSFGVLETLYVANELLCCAIVIAVWWSKP